MADVRMRGFAKRSSVADAEALIAARITPLGVERVPFALALGRTLAEDVVPSENVPPHAKSMMDGYAVRAADLPARLRVAGQLMAADRFEGVAGAGEAVRIMTGARLPAGTDTVVMVEQTTLEGDQVTIAVAQPAGTHVLQAGDDLTAGRPILTAGRRLRPQDVAMLVTAGALEVAVQRRPRVRIIPTGNELVPVGRPAEGRVVESNSYLLAALAQRDGADPILYPIVPDDRGLLERALTEPGADLIVMTGGSSVGQEDLGPVIVAAIGELAIHGLHVKPASPTGIGFVRGVPVVLAPGFPVASFVAWDLFVRPIVQRMLGAPAALPYPTRRVRLAAGIEKPAHRVDVVRVVLGGGPLPEATGLPGGAALLSTTTRADGFLLLAAGTASYPAGAELDVHLYD